MTRLTEPFLKRAETVGDAPPRRRDAALGLADAGCQTAVLPVRPPPDIGAVGRTVALARRLGVILGGEVTAVQQPLDADGLLQEAGSPRVEVGAVASPPLRSLLSPTPAEIGLRTAPVRDVLDAGRGVGPAGQRLPGGAG